MTKYTKHCDECGSQNIWADAMATWNVHEQEWLMRDKFGYVFCRECDCECSVETKEVPEVSKEKPNKYEVHHYAMCGGWSNCWTKDDKPWTFASQEAAQAEIDELINDMTDYDSEEFRIYDLELKEYVG